MIEVIQESWKWIGLKPQEVVATNSFGNVIVNGVHWRICPEELSCVTIARDTEEFDVLWKSEEFQLDWEMARVVAIACDALGPLSEGRCYCLKQPGVLGGAYVVANISTITVRELISFAGDLAEQIKDIPDGGTIQFEIIR